VDVRDYVLPVPVSELATTEQYLAVLKGHPAKFAPGARFAYGHSGYVVLALVAERAAGLPLHELVVERVSDRAGLTDTAFIRSDEPAERTAHGYLDAEGLRTNVFHLPVRGSGDGGIYSTAADIRGLWKAFFAGLSRPRRWRRWCAHAATCRQRRSGMGSGSGSTRPATRPSSRATTRACPSARFTIREAI
jgi:CubicO group peptidase (beta-lactamase class C family)